MRRKIGHIRERRNKFILYYRGKYMGTFETWDEAEKSRLSLIEIYEPVELSEFLPLFADRLNLAIGKSNRTVRSICRQAGINPTSITHYLNGGTPSVKNVMGLALALNVSVDYLLGLKKEEK